MSSQKSPNREEKCDFTKEFKGYQIPKDKPVDLISLASQLRELMEQVSFNPVDVQPLEN